MNYLQARTFWIRSFVAGLLLGSLMGGALVWHYKHQLKDVVAKMQLFFAVFISICIATPLLHSWLNRAAVSTAKASPTTVILESQQARFSSRFGNSRLQKQQANQYLLFFYRDGQLYRIQDDQLFFPGAESGDTLNLDIVKGRLGYEWVILD